MRNESNADRKTDSQTAREIKVLLSKSNIRHGVAFRAMEQGLTAEQLAAQWNRSVGHARSIMRSVKYLLEGELPGASAMAYTNSFAYREIWEVGASPELMTYVKGCLRELAARNPEVRSSRWVQSSFQVSRPNASTRSQSRSAPSAFSRCPATAPRRTSDFRFIQAQYEGEDFRKVATAAIK